MATPGVGAHVDVFAATKETTEATVIPRIVTQSQQIARYFTDDLKYFLRETGFDLIKYLDIPDDYPQDTDEVIEMLYEDTSHLIRDKLITGINLLISDPDPDPNLRGAYRLRYYALYQLEVPNRVLKLEDAKRFGGYLAPPPAAWRGTRYRFALLIDWEPSANEKRRKAMRPEYCFDWVPEQASFDARTLVRYRSGGMTMDGARVVTRDELASPDYQGQ
jgi:hypothetical protein